MHRGFKCKYPECDKAYGSENSLSQHIKIKHPQYSEKLKEDKGQVSGSKRVCIAKNYEFDEQELFFEDDTRESDCRKRSFNFEYHV